jgi:hypothetical protein
LKNIPVQYDIRVFKMQGGIQGHISGKERLLKGGK